MRRRLICSLLIAMLALPVSVFAPAAFGASAAEALAGTEHCATHAQTPPGDDCPCCPDEGNSMASCLSMCAVTAAPPPVVMPVPLVRAPIPPSHAAASFSTRSDLPFKPPPIP
jgi:hypothetical protein